MNPASLVRKSAFEWWIPAQGRMRVPGVIYASEALIREMDEKVREQVSNVAMLPGIQRASYAMPDAHWGYGFPIGGVAAFDPEEGGVISAGGVGFDISCGVRTLRTGVTAPDVEGVKDRLATALLHGVPAGVGSRGRIHLEPDELDAMLLGGGSWAVGRGFGDASDLRNVEEHGRVPDAKPEWVSARAKRRQEDEMGTLGSGNHYLEVQRVADVRDEKTAAGFGLHRDDIVVSIHCGSRGLGHQIGTEFLREMVSSSETRHIALPDRELACAPVRSAIGQRYLGRHLEPAGGVSAPCGQVSTAPSPTGRSSRTLSARPSATCCLRRPSRSSMTCHTTPASSRSTPSTAPRVRCSSIARAPRAHSVPDTPASPNTCVLPGNRC